MTEALVETVDVEKLFPLTQSLADTLAGREKHVIHAVDGVSLQVQKGEAVGLIGESGSGKPRVWKRCAPRFPSVTSMSR